MLSICIPVYNYDVTNLVGILLKQCSEASIEFEIIVFEDGSDKNRINNFTQTEYVRHIIFSENQGRSKARNILASESKFNKILFLDCDSLPPTDKYINNYLEKIDYSVVCGGTTYRRSQYKKEYSLRYIYGIKREKRAAENRNQNPNKSFTTNNFLVSRDVFELIKFREFLTKYGHEDSLFGYDLDKQGIKILHVDNPVIHCGLEDNVLFLSKTRTAIENLLSIENYDNIDKEFLLTINLITAYLKYKKTGLILLLRLFFNIFEKQIEKHLCYSGKPLMLLFDIYKIAYYSKLKKHGKNTI